MGIPFTPERLLAIRRLRKARRLYKKQPLFAYGIMRNEYPDYTYEQFWDDLRYRKPRIKKKGKCPLFRYGRYFRMQKLIAMYRNTDEINFALQALRLARHMTKPYRVVTKIGGNISEYSLSPLIAIELVEKLTANLRDCTTEQETDEMVDKFRKEHIYYS
jgi:hypothetical protein